MRDFPKGMQTALSTLLDRKSTRLNSSHPSISYAVFCAPQDLHSFPTRTLFRSTFYRYSCHLVQMLLRSVGTYALKLRSQFEKQFHDLVLLITMQSRNGP